MESQPQNPEFRNNPQDFPEKLSTMRMIKRAKPLKSDCVSPKVKHQEIVIAGKFA